MINALFRAAISTYASKVGFSELNDLVESHPEWSPEEIISGIKEEFTYDMPSVLLITYLLREIQNTNSQEANQQEQKEDAIQVIKNIQNDIFFILCQMKHVKVEVENGNK